MVLDFFVVVIPMFNMNKYCLISVTWKTIRIAVYFYQLPPNYLDIVYTPSPPPEVPPAPPPGNVVLESVEDQHCEGFHLLYFVWQGDHK